MINVNCVEDLSTLKEEVEFEENDVLLEELSMYDVAGDECREDGNFFAADLYDDAYNIIKAELVRRQVLSPANHDWNWLNVAV